MSTGPAPEALPRKVRDLLETATQADLRGPDRDTLVQKGNAGPATALVTGPAAFFLSALADAKLGKAGEAEGLGEKQVTRLTAQWIGESKVLLIKAVIGGDRTVFQVRRRPGGSGCRFNLFPLLGPARMTVASGWRERYDVFSVPTGHPYWPGLLIDLGHPTERTKAPVRKKRARKKKPAPPPVTT